jgi:hypothetical protein
MTASISRLNSRHLSMKWSTSKKWLTSSSAIWRRVFRALVASRGLLRSPAQERPRKSEGSTPRCTNITTIIFPRIIKTAMRNPANEGGLLYGSETWEETEHGNSIELASRHTAVHSLASALLKEVIALYER